MTTYNAVAPRTPRLADEREAWLVTRNSTSYPTPKRRWTTSIRRKDACLGSPKKRLDIALKIPEDEALVRRIYAMACERHCCDQKDLECAFAESELIELLDQARSKRPFQVRRALWRSPKLRQMVEEMVGHWHAEFGIEESEPAAGLDKNVWLANQLVAHSWQRFLRQVFMSPPRAEDFSDPAVALNAVANWANCVPVICVLERLSHEDGRNRILYAAAALHHLARTGSLYRSEKDAGVGHDDMRPVFLTPAELSERFLAKYRTLWRYEDRVTTLILNPRPRSLDAAGIRYDGTCFRDAVGESFARAWSAAASYYAPGICGELKPPRDVTDRGYRIGTLLHSFRSALKLHASRHQESLITGNDESKLALSLVDEALRWRRDPDRSGIDPAWLAALHLAYSSGQEALSMPQLHAVWKDRIHEALTVKLDRYDEYSDERSPWLTERLGMLPPLDRDPSDYVLEQLVTFFRDEVPYRAARAADPDDELYDREEAARLRAWCIAGNKDTLRFYRTPSEHFDMVGMYFYDRLQNLLPLDKHWTLAAAYDAVERHDMQALSLRTNWLPDADRTARFSDEESNSARSNDSARALERLDYFHQVMVSDPSLLARARERILVEGGDFTNKRKVAATAARLAFEISQIDAETHPFTFRNLTSLLPLTGWSDADDDFQFDLLQQDLIDEGQLSLSLSDMYGPHLEHVFSKDILACSTQGRAALVSSEVRMLPLFDSSKAVRAKRVGAVYREIAADTVEIVPKNELIVHEPSSDGFRRLTLNTLRTSPPPPISSRILRETEDWLVRSPVRRTRARAPTHAFADLFVFAENSEPMLCERLEAVFDDALQRSHTLRWLVESMHGSDSEPISIFVDEGLPFRTSFAGESLLPDTLVMLGSDLDARHMRYASTRGLEVMSYRRAALSEMVLALTGARSTQVDSVCPIQVAAVDTLSRQWTELAHRAGEWEEISDKSRREIAQAERRLTEARSALQMMYEDMAATRGVVVYLVDRILQDCGDPSPEQVMSLTGKGADAERMALMTERRSDAAARMHAENEVLDMRWMDNIDVRNDTQVVGTQTVGDRPVVSAWSAFLEKKNPAIQAGRIDAWISDEVPALLYAPDLKDKITTILTNVTNRSPTFRRLLSVWLGDPRRNSTWAFSVPSDRMRTRSALTDMQTRQIDVSATKYIVGSCGVQRITLDRSVVSGIVDLMLHDIGLDAPEDREKGRRWLGTAIEQRILEEAGMTKTVRVNSAVFSTRDDIPESVNTNLSAQRRAALLEDAFIRKRS